MSRSIREIIAATRLPEACGVGQTRGLYATSRSRQGIEHAAKLFEASLIESGAIQPGDFYIYINEYKDPIWIAKTPEGTFVAHAPDETLLKAKLDELYTPISDSLMRERARYLMGESEKLRADLSKPACPREKLVITHDITLTYALRIDVRGAVNHAAAYAYVDRISTPQNDFSDNGSVSSI